MAKAGPPSVVEAPLLAPPASGLLYASRVLRDNAVSGRDEFGTLLLPEGCGAWTVQDPCDFSSEAPGEAPAVVYGAPFVIDAEDVCTSSSNDVTDARARRLLETVTHPAVERELWDGPVQSAHAADGARWFGDETAVVVSGTLASPVAVSPRLGLALLEEFLGGTASGGLGVIHATRATASLLMPFVAGGQPITRTPLGSLFAAGSGYSGAGPNGNAAPSGKRWMYASDPIEVRLHAPTVTDQASSVDRDINRIRTRARRTASFASSWCRLGAVLVDLTA
jgi:hypothetical protein